MPEAIHLRITNQGGLRIIAFDNPSKKNAINQETYIGLRVAINEAAADDSVQVLALTGVGEYFSSGNQIGNLGNLENMEEYLDVAVVNVRKLVHAFVYFPKLFVAVVNGPSIGIAATLVALCDVVYASDTAYFYTPFTMLGLSAEGCSSYTFPRILGPSKAAEMLLYNHRMDAAEALKFGFVAEVFPGAELETKLWPKIKGLTKLAHGSVVATKRLMGQQRERDLLGACEQEIVALRQRFNSEDALNAMMSFMSRKSKL